MNNNTSSIGDRKAMLEHHIIHEFDKALAIANLRGCYGAVCRMYYEQLIREVKGTRVLDGGCGFGLFSKMCLERGFFVHSIDIDDESLLMARELFRIPCRKESIYQTSLGNDSIDTAILTDVIEHLEFDALLKEFSRLGVERIIVSDSNTHNPALRMYRRWAEKEEFQEYHAEDVVARFKKAGFALTKFEYSNVLCLPVSGGLQRKPLPILHRFPGALVKIDNMLNDLLEMLRLQKILDFHYVAVLDKKRIGES